jgi:superfamily II DNA or RNA helicase
VSFAVGSLVKARGREWVVLPESDDNLLVLRPLGGTDDEISGVYLPLETVEAARFDLPDPSTPGDATSSRLLRDAVRLGFRSSAGPFRSFAKIAVEPRPYQLVPLLMALKLDPVRLLISDDVGIGKTIEAALIARELIDRGEVDRLAVLCSPQLAEQWQQELREKFHLDAELVLASTATRLERRTRLGQSLFEVYPYVVVSTDFIKSDRRRAEFLRSCPELVIVDEAHTCAWSGEGRGARHQRHQLVADLAANRRRHLLLVTATPHSGNEAAFRSLLALLDPSFADLPEDLSGPTNERQRRRLAQQFVQRRRGDIRHYLQADTPFPEREEREETYKLAPEYKRFFERVLAYARETVRDTSGGHFRQRVRWWSGLALLRSLASSPAAAADTLRSRSASADTDTPEAADDVGRRTVLDLVEDEPSEGIDLPPGADDAAEPGVETSARRRLLALAREADGLRGRLDLKLQRATELVAELVRAGYSPIVFCRFIPTAEYVAEHLRGHLRNVEVAAVTGRLAPTERQERVSQLSEASKRVLVATDCLSEGINLQERFDAVVHYDLSWNPTRHEQREGRVDRFGQRRDTVRVLTYWGVDNQIDGIVLQVLIRKHRTIRSSLGVSVPVPIDTDQVVEAIFESLLLRENVGLEQQAALPLFEELLKPQTEALNRTWEAAAERERRSRTMFAQEQLAAGLAEVQAELAAVQSAIGSSLDVAHFTADALRAHGAVVGGDEQRLEVDLTEVPRALREALAAPLRFSARFTPPATAGELYLSRTDPIVEGLASYVMDTALDPLGQAAARRSGVMRTAAVARRTTLLLVRFRYHLVSRTGSDERQILAEDCQLLAFRGAPSNAEWLTADEAEALLAAQPSGNVAIEQARGFLSQVVDQFDQLRPHLDAAADQRGQELLEAHRRVRAAARQSGVRQTVEPQLPPDVLGLYIFLPSA